MSQSTAKRTTKTRNFTIIDNKLINSPLTLESKALLIWALSKPSGWHVSTVALSTIHNISKTKVQRLVNELKAAGYLTIHRYSDGSTVWEWSEIEQKEQNVNSELVEIPVLKPYPENQDGELSPISGDNPDPYPEKPDPEKPDPDNQDALVRTDLLERTKFISKTPQSPPEGGSVDKKNELDFLFHSLWDIWPNKSNMISAKVEFKLFYMKNLDNPQMATEYLILDAKQRTRRQQLGFDKMHLSNYLKNSRFLDAKQLTGYQ